MTEQIFTDLDFERNLVTIEESGHDNDFYYYTLDIGDICLISNANDEAKEEGWYCSIFDSATCKITDERDLAALVNILESNTNGN